MSEELSIGAMLNILGRGSPRSTDSKNDTLNRLFWTIGDEILRARALIERLEDYQRKIGSVLEDSTPKTDWDKLEADRFEERS